MEKTVGMEQERAGRRGEPLRSLLGRLFAAGSFVAPQVGELLLTCRRQLSRESPSNFLCKDCWAPWSFRRRARPTRLI